MIDFNLSKRFHLYKISLFHGSELIKTKIATKMRLNNAVKKKVYKKENNNK